jgi:hypothetical protein
MDGDRHRVEGSADCRPDQLFIQKAMDQTAVLFALFLRPSRYGEQCYEEKIVEPGLTIEAAFNAAPVASILV